MRVSMTFAGAALAAGLAVPPLAPAQGQDPNYARNIAATCTACHGTDGRSVGGVPPSLAGQDKNYLLQQLQDFKSGKRSATIMQQHAKGYTDEQLELIAAYFAGMKGGQGAAAPAARGGSY
jgi:sulfide dehydrogenase cytochrome subunit